MSLWERRIWKVPSSVPRPTKFAMCDLYFLWGCMTVTNHTVTNHNIKWGLSSCSLVGKKYEPSMRPPSLLGGACNSHSEIWHAQLAFCRRSNKRDELFWVKKTESKKITWSCTTHKRCLLQTYTPTLKQSTPLKKIHFEIVSIIFGVQLLTSWK